MSIDQSSVGAAKKPELDQETIDLYARVNAQYKSLEKDRNDLRDTIIAAMQGGAECPTGGPYLVNLSYQERATASWKDICEAILSILGERLKAKALAIILHMQSDKKSVPQLTIAANPDWEG